MRFPIVRYGQIPTPKTGSAPAQNPGSNLGQIRGAGDVLEKMLRPGVKLIDSMLGTKLAECDDCKARRRWLNRLLPL